MNVAFGQEPIDQRRNLSTIHCCSGPGGGARWRSRLIDWLGLECNAFYVYQVARRDVIRSNITSPGPTPKRHRRLEVGCESDRPVRRRAVYHNPRCGHPDSVFAGGVPALSVYRSRVPHPAVPEYLSTSLTAFVEIIDHIIGKDRRKLLHRQRMIASNAGKLTDHRA